VHSASFYFGHHLAAWRPGVDYRTVYSSHRAQGGGVILDVGIHELDLALWWFGQPARMLSLPRRTGLLEGDVEDVCDLSIEFRSGVVANLHLNYLDPTYRRSFLLSGDQASLEGFFGLRTLTKRTADGKIEEIDLSAHDKNEMYVDQMRHFLDVVQRKARPIFTLADSTTNLEVALDARDRGPYVVFPRRGALLEKVPAVIQARLGSTRLPGKVLKTAAGKTMLELLVERLRRCRRIDQIIVATSEAPSDRAIVEVAERIGVPWFVGSEQDVLARYVGAVRKFDLPAVVRITADCPLHDPAIVDQCIARFCAERPDYCSNIHPRSIPDGLDVEVMSRWTLESADRDSTSKPDREHVTHYIYTHPERFEILAAAPGNAELAKHRWTLDTPADYELIKAIFESLYPQNPDFRMSDVLSLIARDEHIQSLSRAIT
jgi:spore coat polysaccharide biosynthesis protein SpsF